ncbi:MAG: hypothetical protein C5B53_05965 [Candidatus Melainabacteria bacterium]|nr:MAG: hypothetical protein C5B53_05965 [Candidatus Melainabacteria bacterium]
MDLVRGIDQERANALAYQHLKPRERLLWAGRKRLRGVELAFLILLLPPLFLLVWQIVVQARQIPLLEMLVYFAPALLFCVFAARANKRVVMALTDRRIMIIYPERSIHWFLNEDLKAVYPTIDADGTGDVKFLFKRPVQAENRVISSDRHLVPGMVAGVTHTEFSFDGITHAWVLQALTLGQLQANDEVRPRASMR